MKNEMNGFKVVCCRREWDDDALASAVMNSDSPLFTVYEIGEPASNENGPLMFFPELEDARKFVLASTPPVLSKSGHIQIWSCTATNARLCARILSLAYITADQAASWWRDGRSRHHHAAIDAPKGTFVADTITLVEQVDVQSNPALPIDEDE